ncbi:hypothetical protein D5H75_29025 [Bailinhaonella thermotolerans]|uniref:Uncharacterized protein n=1 Tax=Bailinhaonella thermotolerans TaxID=1070861 RepID=A0A3A4AGL7_9ACTN|nr:hypothetical protein D5H75_29025 [Bailinhaonella thermotolerans]
MGTIGKTHVNICTVIRGVSAAFAVRRDRGALCFVEDSALVHPPTDFAVLEPDELSGEGEKEGFTVAGGREDLTGFRQALGMWNGLEDAGGGFLEEPAVLEQPYFVGRRSDEVNAERIHRFPDRGDPFRRGAGGELVEIDDTARGGDGQKHGAIGVEGDGERAVGWGGVAEVGASGVLGDAAVGGEAEDGAGFA